MAAISELQKELEQASLEKLIEGLQLGPRPDGDNRRYYSALAELERRKFLGQMEVDEAQKNAAKAAIEAAEAAKTTAEYTKRNARYMLWSVVAILVTSGVSAVIQVTSCMR
jgi:hypothetical protein